jgi:Transglycosylase SLT domain
MHKVLQFGLLFILAVMQLPAAEIANLRNGFNIRHERHESLGKITRLYIDNETGGSFVDVATSQIDSFESAPPEPDQAGPQTSTSRNLGTIIGDASSRSRIDADFIASVIHAESANNPRAVSRAGAQGLMQLMPETARNLGVKDSFDPVDNVDGGVRFLRELLLRYHGDAAKALAAYNAGPHRVEQYKGVPPYRETQAYVARVISDYNRRKLAQRQPPSKLTAEASGPASKLDTIAEKAQPNPADAH